MRLQSVCGVMAEAMVYRIALSFIAGVLFGWLFGSSRTRRREREVFRMVLRQSRDMDPFSRPDFPPQEKTS